MQSFHVSAKCAKIIYIFITIIQKKKNENKELQTSTFVNVVLLDDVIFVCHCVV